MLRRNQVRQATLDLGGTFRADRRRGGTRSADEDDRETSRSSGRAVRPDARLSSGRTVREGASRGSLAHSNTGDEVVFADTDADTDPAPRSEAAGDPGRGRDMRDSDSHSYPASNSPFYTLLHGFRRHEQRDER